MRIKSKDEVINTYKARYPELDFYFVNQLSDEYDKYYTQIKDLEDPELIKGVFHKAMERNEMKYKENAYIKGVERSLNNQYMSILAAYGLIVFFRDNMIEWE
jgi:hypothetical protein